MRTGAIRLTAAVLTTGAVISLATAETAQAAKTCGFGWAKPGKYIISGNFRGQVESASARLTNDCRISLQIPGVFSGSRLKRSGKCLRFALKIEGERKVFFAKWCNTYGLVPWKGRTIRASIKRLSIEAPATKVKRNYNN
jgi:hypothetical protein